MSVCIFVQRLPLIMLGLDIKVKNFNLLLVNLRVESIFFKLGSIEQFCLKVNSVEVDQTHPCGMFLVLDVAEHAELLTSLIDVVLVSENKSVVGRGQNLMSVQPRSVETFSPGFQLLDTLDCDVSIIHETANKPDISLGTLSIQIKIFDLRATTPCMCSCNSGTTSHNVSVEADTVYSSDDASSELAEEDDDDSSLDNFLRRLKGRTATVQTAPEVASSTTQTMPKVEKPFREKVLRVSKSGVDREVLSLIAPRGRSRTQDPAFFTAPPRRTVQLVARPSSARVPEVKRKVTPKPRNAVAANNTHRPPLYAPKVEPRKKITHELPWY